MSPGRGSAQEWADGAAGDKLIATMRRQVQALGVEMLLSKVDVIERRGDSDFRALGTDGWLTGIGAAATAASAMHLRLSTMGPG